MSEDETPPFSREPKASASLANAERPSEAEGRGEKGEGRNTGAIPGGDQEDCRASLPPAPSKLRAWLQLLRVPNLLTVPGDPLAGFFLACWAFGCPPWLLWPALVVAGASLLLYAAGLIQNDILDLAEDRAERPDRPLASGRISTRAAWAAYWVMVLSGLWLASLGSYGSLTIGVVIVLLSTFYNGWAKRQAFIGPIAIGLCRGLSLLMGTVLVGNSELFGIPRDLPRVLEIPVLGYMVTAWALRNPFVLLAFWGMTLYIAAVTQVARGETQRRSLGLDRWLPATVLLAWFPLGTFALILRCWTGLMSEIMARNPIPEITQLICFGGLGMLAMAWAMHCADLLKGKPEPVRVQRTVGMLISGLLFIQAALTALVPWPGLLVSGILLAAWPVFRRLGRWFYAS